MAQYWVFLVAFLIPIVATQSPPGSVCFWRDARSGVVRDTLYIEGGWQGVMVDAPQYRQRDAGLAQFNFSSSFDQSSNFTDLFLTKKIIQERDPMLRTHINGFMFADVDEWYAFGGRAAQSANNLQDDTGIIRDALYSPNAFATNPALGFSTNIKASTNNSTTLYITNGAGVSIPSESLGFYFSGLHSSNNTHLSNYASANGSDSPSVLSKSMLRVNTQSFGSSDWSELPLPPSVTPRAEAVVAWIPIGRRGALVVIGGVPFPASLASSCKLNSSIITTNNAQAPAYMSDLPVYDIASGTWYIQSTNGPTPPQLAQACAVVASSSDNLVHNIHVYGGYNGVNEDPATDDVWILSVPSFTWIKVPSTNPSHGRSSHVCAKPYPDQMMVVGGTTNCNIFLQTTAFADVFNLNTLTWTGKYDPTKWSEYTIPSAISNAIKATPTASMNSGLLAVFKTPYPGTIPKWYPYASLRNNSTSDTSASNSSSQSTYLKWLIPVIVVVALSALATVGILGWCKRRRRQQSGGKRSRRSIVQWIRGQPMHEKSVKSDDETTQVNSSYGIHEATGDLYFRKPAAQTLAAELNSNSNWNSGYGTPLGTPRGPISPSSRGTAELYTQASRHELDGEYPNNSLDNRYSTNHPMHLSSMSYDATESQTERVPSFITDRDGVYELPHKRSDEEMIPQSINNVVSGQNTAQSPSIAFTSPGIAATSLTGNISPNITSADASPNQEPLDVPATPPQKSSDATRPMHTRNISSLSSGLPDLGSPSAYEDQRRSIQIAALPDLPTSKERDVVSDKETDNIVSSATPTDGGRSPDTDPSPILQRPPGLGIMSHGAQRTVKILRRKELPSSSHIHERMAPSEDNAPGKGPDVP